MLLLGAYTGYTISQLKVEFPLCCLALDSFEDLCGPKTGSCELCESHPQVIPKNVLGSVLCDRDYLLSRKSALLDVLTMHL